MNLSRLALLAFLTSCSVPQETEDRLATAELDLADAESEIAALQAALDAAIERIGVIEGSEPGEQALRLAKVEDDVDNLSASQLGADEERAQLRDDLDATSDQVSANTEATAKNAADVSTNATNIAGNQDEILVHASELSKQATNIAGNTSKIAALDVRVKANTSGISTNGASISANGTAVASNRSAVASNTSKIASNTSRGTSNTSKIASNTSRGTSNTSKIASNTSGVASNTSKIASNTSRVATNEADIAANEAEIITLGMYSDVQWSTFTTNDGRDTGLVTNRKLSFTKASATTDLDITYYDNFRVYGYDRGCRWEVLIDGKSCSSPGPIIGDHYIAVAGASWANKHSLGTIHGVCKSVGGKDITKAAHTLTIKVGSVPGYGGSDCYTGWASTRGVLSLRELQR